MRSFNVVVFRKVMNSPTEREKGFKTVLYTRWRGVTNFRSMISYLDKNAPDWWYVNVYSRPAKEYEGRIYTDSRNWQQFRR